jgi:hypothetical protein
MEAKRLDFASRLGEKHPVGLGVRLAMFDAQKLISSVGAVVNYFTIRIAVAAALALLLYRMTGSYYLDLIGARFGSLAFNIDVKSLLELVGNYIQLSNAQNTLFVVSVMVCLSLLDLLYRFVCWVGYLMPLMLVYNSTYPKSARIYTIARAWRRYYHRFSFDEFQTYLGNKMSTIPTRPISPWHLRFEFCRSAMFIVLLVYLLTPGVALKVSFGWFVLVELVVLICMLICGLMESSIYANDEALRIETATAMILAEAQGEVEMSDIEFFDANEVYLKNYFEIAKRKWRRFTCVALRIGYPYLGTVNPWALEPLHQPRELAGRLLQLLLGRRNRGKANGLLPPIP